MAGSETLSRTERIRQRPEFERVYERGNKVQGRYMLFFVLPNGRATPRFGVAATRKLGSAVERNRVKRLARELFRRSKLPTGLDIVVVPRRDMLHAPFASIESDYHAVLVRRHERDGRTRVARGGPHAGRNSRV
jgi:ribonuclease P protein component